MMSPACPRTADGGRPRAKRWKFPHSPSSAPRDARPPMRSLPMPPARCQYLPDLPARGPGPRKRRGRRHPLAGLLAAGTAAVIAGSRSFAAIGQRAAGAGPEVPAVLGAVAGARRKDRRSGTRSPWPVPMCSTVFSVPGCGGGPCRPAAGWLSPPAGRPSAARGRRGGQGREGPAPGRGPGTRHRRGPRPGRRGRESNKIPRRCGTCCRPSPASPPQSSRPAQCTRSVIPRRSSPARGAGYVMTVKGSMPTLYKQLKKLSWAALPAVSSVGTDHG